MLELHVSHRNGSYPVRFRPLTEAIANLPADRIVVTDENVARLYRSQFPGSERVLVVPPGERSKSIACWGDLQSQLAFLGARRRTSIVAFGGGVVGDLAGFVSATYMRGVPLIQIPTSLLSQVDSSVGGKVGIDIEEGKNMVGAFYPPDSVDICVETLETLPVREFRNGMAEVWKYGFILDSDFVTRLDKGNIGRDDMILRCIELKKRIVESDEFESVGDRAKLNFGHTVGHAIENVTGYGPILHGEAISIGMVAEAALGEAIGLTRAGATAVVRQCLDSAGLPTTSIVLRDVDMLVASMRRDKKAASGRLAFSLLTEIGGCKLCDDIEEADVRAVLANL